MLQGVIHCVGEKEDDMLLGSFFKASREESSKFEKEGSKFQPRINMGDGDWWWFHSESYDPIQVNSKAMII